ncbi:MAG: RagB/SusD family nutrient uptake outer membrane protein, partial [Bacteroidales bacterium]|nr:RagB/SusD family nutrient uptake outer membrane protein [Bacteroidales bacterium]
SELTLQEVKNEKLFECWLEGTRYFDLVRWGDTAEFAQNGKSYPNFQDRFFFSEKEEKDTGMKKTAVHTGYVNKNDADWCTKMYPEAGFKDKHKLFPFPWSETQVNENIVQNPGWE